jgi:hypothetical protein
VLDGLIDRGCEGTGGQVAPRSGAGRFHPLQYAPDRRKEPCG